ncbi:MAG: divergent PAP2 family protein [Clostridiales bacterium]|nr:divergent PAP2 family protein [Clostridiales bacterium]
MNFFLDLWQNDALKCACLSWVAAQALKVLLTMWIEKRFDWRRCFGMGGMPSSHSAFVFSLMVMIGLREGTGTAAFALAFALAAVVIYDAMGVRAETGRQGMLLNRLLREVLIEGKPITEKKLKELVGHTPLEVAGGILVGAVMVLILA